MRWVPHGPPWQALRLDALGEDVDAFWVDEGPDPERYAEPAGRIVERLSCFLPMNDDSLCFCLVYVWFG